MADIDIENPEAADAALSAAITNLHVGGWREVADIAARDAIPAERRAEGMVAYVQADGVEYQLVGGVANGDWIAVADVAGGTRHRSVALSSDPVLFSVRDQDGRRGLDLSPEAVLSVQHLKLRGQEVRHRSAGAAPFKVRDAAGRAALYVTSEGKTWARLDGEALDQLRSDLGNGSGHAFRGTGDVIDVRSTSDLITATLREDGWAGEVTQRVGGTLDTAYVKHPAPALGVFFFGQSNAGSGGVATTSMTTALYPRHAVQFSAGQAQYGTGAVSAATLDDIVPARNGSGIPPLGAPLTGFALEALARRHGEASPGIFTRTDWYGGEPLTTFVKGTTTYNNLLVSITRAVEVHKAYGRGLFPVIIFVQGEGGPNGQTTYTNLFRQLIDDLRADVKAITGIEPPFLFWQINSEDSNTAAWSRTITLAQLAIAREFDGTSVSMIGPMYHLPLVDLIHQTEEGRMMLGELSALVVREVQRKGFFRPLRPKSVSRSGAVITIDFHLPGGPIAFDADWIAAATNYGFTYSDDSGAPPAISSVAITGDAQVQVTLAAEPTGANKVIAYAQKETDLVDDQWASTRGQLYSSSGEPSVYAARGFTVPADIRHYCVRFEETVI